MTNVGCKALSVVLYDLGVPTLHHLRGLLLREEEGPGYRDHRLRLRRRNFPLRASRNLSPQRIRLERDQHGDWSLC